MGHGLAVGKRCWRPNNSFVVFETRARNQDIQGLSCYAAVQQCLTQPVVLLGNAKEIDMVDLRDIDRGQVNGSCVIGASWILSE